jgi:hypothetical protein
MTSLLAISGVDFVLLATINMFESLHKVLYKESLEWPSVKHIHVEYPASGAAMSHCYFIPHHFISTYLKLSTQKVKI